MITDRDWYARYCFGIELGTNRGGSCIIQPGVLMKLRALWILPIFATALMADPNVVTCTPGAASVPIFSTSSVSGAVGDYTLTCTGGLPSPPIQIDVGVSMNVPLLTPGAWILTDGVNNTPGTFESSNAIEFFGVPFTPPGSGSVELTVENIFVNPSLEPPGFQFTASGAIFGNITVDIANPLEVVAQNAVPEPSTVPFVGLVLAAMWLARRVSLRLAKSR
jgi:hypothetical protein